jgi:predicted ATPase/DNA-binding winged helix-turn-helix (wHTH) protein
MLRGRFIDDRDRTTIVQFGPFRLDSQRRELVSDGAPVPIGNRAFDILIQLIEARGELVTKDELLTRVWPDTVVEENALQFQISTLRKALGKDRGFIKTASGRGYRFVADIASAAGHAPPPPDVQAGPAEEIIDVSPPHNLPVPISHLIGREEHLSYVADLIAQHRLVTLVGAGGIGKTRLGIETARSLLSRFADGVWVADLGPLSDPALVLPTVATILGVTGGGGSPERLASALAPRRILLVLDDCAHVVQAVASLAEALLHASVTVRTLVTSREPVRAEGECVYRVPPLDVPTDDTEDMDQVMQASAVRLFVAQARAAEPQLSVDARFAAAAANICRRLDGIPLAIELAAARVAALGAEEVAARLDDRFSLLKVGRRNAPARHQTLRATLDWSYELLTETERLVLRRLAIFVGGFGLEAANAVAASDEIGAAEIVESTANLVAKSLVSVDFGGHVARYRLLETTRAYALQKLAETGEIDRVARRHAQYYRALLERTETTSGRATRGLDWSATHAPDLANTRAALEWAFSSRGDAAVAVELTIAAIPLWFELSLFPECRQHTKRAIAMLGAHGDARSEMQLYSALAASLFHTKGPVRDTFDAWKKAMEIAEMLGADEYQLRALWGLWSYRLNRGEHRAALALAEDFAGLAGSQTDRTDLPIADRLIGTALHYLGDQTRARYHLERMLERYIPSHNSDIARFQLDPRIATFSVLARVLWLQGFAEQALTLAAQNVKQARGIGHAVTLFNALLGAGQIALLAGDLTAAEQYVTMLVDHSTRHAMGIWTAWAGGLRGAMLIQGGDAASSLPILRAVLSELQDANSVPRFGVLFRPFAMGLAQTGHVSQGLMVIGEALEQCERNSEYWIVAELLRIQGVLLKEEGAIELRERADDNFRRSLALAREQGALSWELRSAISLAQLWHEHGRTPEARELILPIYDRFTEGFETADLKTATALLNSFRQGT